MTTLKQLLQRTHDNLQILEERRARQGSTPDLKLLNEIEDHQKAIELIEEALASELTETGPYSNRYPYPPTSTCTDHLSPSRPPHFYFKPGQRRRRRSFVRDERGWE